MNRDRYDDEQTRSCVLVCLDLHFPTPGRKDEVRKAKLVCAECLVRKACLETALANNEHFGIWGGLTDTERQAERRRRGMTGTKSSLLTSARRALLSASA